MGAMSVNFDAGLGQGHVSPAAAVSPPAVTLAAIHRRKHRFGVSAGGGVMMAAVTARDAGRRDRHATTNDA